MEIDLAGMVLLSAAGAVTPYVCVALGEWLWGCYERHS